MADLRRVPPGRAGRLWLSNRLRAAQRAGSLLDRRLRILLIEQQRFESLVMRTGPEWDAAAANAQVWLARGAALGGSRGIDIAASHEAATVDLEWASVMGMRYPSSATLQTAPPDAGSYAVSAALLEAGRAHEKALAAAVTHAAATAALRAVEREIAQTRQRLRAITDRWTPRLEAALAELERRIEETEREETVRLRWATQAATEHEAAP
jgi:V/A-type H+/Na+-transporting ATPase subunit D